MDAIISNLGKICKRSIQAICTMGIISVSGQLAAADTEHASLEWNAEHWVAEVNSNLPKMVDKQTRVEKVELARTEPEQIIYVYKMINHQRTDFDLELLDIVVGHRIIKLGCGYPVNRSIIDKGFELVFAYIDKGGKSIADYPVNIDNCMEWDVENMVATTT